MYWIQQISLAFFQESHGNIFPLFSQGHFRRGFSCSAVPIGSIPKVTFHPVEIGMYPGSVPGTITLGYPMSTIPVPGSFQQQ
jgi:hypothetical protein